LLAKSEGPQSGEPGQYPVEGFLYTFDDTDTYFLSIENYEGEARGDVTVDLFVNGAEIHPDYTVPEYSLSSPSDARGAIAVGAVHWADDILEFYSSQGPTADGRLKPDLAAPSVVDSASYQDEAFNGTSAAAPHVSGAAALVRQAFPNFTPADIATFFEERSLDLGPAGPDNIYGVGRLNLGAAPDDPEPPQTAPSLVSEVQPTSTPRPPQAAGSPGQTVGIVVESGATGQNSGLGESIVLLGLCMICVAGLVGPILLVAGFVVLRRR
jgi:subtilisin family serine protease